MRRTWNRIAPAATRDQASVPSAKMMISCASRPRDQYPMTPTARYAADMMGVLRLTAPLKREGCRIDPMISTYANCPPYLLHTHNGDACMRAGIS